MKLNIAVVGATGMVGRNMLNILMERNFPIKDLYLFSSKKSAGTFLNYNNKDILVEELNEENIKNKKIDIALFSAGGNVSLKYAPIFVNYGATVIDNSSAWRMNPDVPLVVPEVNPEDVLSNKGIIANPNCSTIQAMVALQPLKLKYGINRIIYSTYQAVSGAGTEGYNDLIEGYKGAEPNKFPYPIVGNIIPHIDTFLDNGYSKEEIKMIDETKKILHDYDLKVTATTVRVPVTYSHCESINIELKSAFDISDIFEMYSKTPGIVLQDDVKNLVYPMPLFAADKDPVFIGRIRRDYSIESGLNIWVVADNIRKGAALNAVQIAELFINHE